MSLFGPFLHLQVAKEKVETGEDASLKVKTMADTLLPISREEICGLMVPPNVLWNKTL